ncbi:hypothetical protein J1605_015250 [Eschrichtius robustus]|uniref:Uncharacterized protein n=1 Tax=Eschrichtius robustus TaxID=9764 RepID=A0AB34GCT8_ESCRO|nr:hypothetical protein J1605_015250 [Eschrichtius robustus]
MQSPAVGPVPPKAPGRTGPLSTPGALQPAARGSGAGEGEGGSAEPGPTAGRRVGRGPVPGRRRPGGGGLTPSGAFPEAWPPRLPRSPGRSRRRPRDSPRRSQRPRNSSGCGSARGLSEGKAGTGGRQLAGRGAARLRRMLSPCPARPRAHDGHPGAQSLSPRGESCAAIRRGPGSARPWSARLPRPRAPLVSNFPCPPPRPCSPRVPCTPLSRAPGPAPRQALLGPGPNLVGSFLDSSLRRRPRPRSRSGRAGRPGPLRGDRSRSPHL